MNKRIFTLAAAVALALTAHAQTLQSDGVFSNSLRVYLPAKDTKTNYSWTTFDPRPFRYWKVSAFEKGSSNLLVTNITLQIYRA